MGSRLRGNDEILYVDASSMTALIRAKLSHSSFPRRREPILTLGVITANEASAPFRTNPTYRDITASGTLPAMSSIGKGVEEIRLWDEAGTFRVIYTARLANTVYVLHAFQKNTERTSGHDLALAKSRYAQLMSELK